MIFYLLIFTIYVINIFYAINLIYKNNNQLSYSVYTLILIILLPFLTPIVAFINFNDEMIKKHLIKKGKYDKALFPEVNNNLIYQNSTITLFNNGETFFDDLIKEIAKAKKSIHINTFIFNTDNIGKKIIKILEEKLKQGVKVIIIYDYFGAKKLKKKYFKQYLALGGELVCFMKLFFKQYLNINYRNHRKMIIIDNDIAYIGGFNIGDEYLSRDHKLGLWADLELKLIGEASIAVQKRFICDYQYITNKQLNLKNYLVLNQQIKNNLNIRIINSGADASTTSLIEHTLLKEIYNAKNYLYILTPYLILNDSFLNALKFAALNNVKIKIILPNKSDHLLVNHATKAYANILNENVEIYFYDKSSFIHSKMLVCDDLITFINSANLDIRSFIYDFELNSVIYDYDFASKCKNLFFDELKHCTKFSQTKKSFFNKSKEAFAKLFSEIL